MSTVGVSLFQLWEMIILWFSRVSWSHGPRGSSPVAWKVETWWI